MAAPKSIDWAKLSWAMTKKVQVGAQSTQMFENGTARYGAFKSASDQVLAKHSVAAQRPKTIDFDAYRKALPNQTAWVNDMEKQFKAATIPKPTDSYTSIWKK